VVHRCHSCRCADLGLPCFLRSGQTSGKHEWRDTCFLPSDDREVIAHHLYEVVVYSHTADFMGMPCDVWAVREMLPTVPVGTAYRGMPVCREFRYFIGGGKILCRHPYWPRDAVPGLTDEQYAKLCEPPETIERPPRPKPTSKIEQIREYHRGLPDDATADEIVLAVAERFMEAEWSVDLLWTERGWFVTDMARAEDSWHWPECRRSYG